MKEIEIYIKVDENKLMTYLVKKGFTDGNVQDLLELIGILEDLKYTQVEKLKTLYHQNKKEKEGGD